MKLLTNGRIRTMNAQQPFASAMAVANGRIIAVGSDDEIRSISGWMNSTEENLGGAVVWPGLTDAHLHLDHYSRSLSYINCETDTRAECINRVASQCQSAPADIWVRGHGWNQNIWPEGFGNASLLDEVSCGHPVYLTAKSLHVSWANSTALKIAGITSQTPDPEGGQIGRDASGNPNGILFESAMALLEKAISDLTPADLQPLLVNTQEKLWSLGLTGVHDFDGINCFAALQALDVAQKLKIRVVKSIPYKSMQQASELKLHSGFGSAFLRIGSIKLFADGALGPRTAAMLQPYENEAEDRGMLLLDSEEIFEIGRQTTLSGLSLATHAIGDLANHEVIRGYAQLRAFEQQNHLAPARHRIEHVQIIHPEDRTLLQQFGIIASMQPLHATSDMYIADRHWGERSRHAYALNSIVEGGISYAFGSDAPVESPNPFLGLHAAVTRTRLDGSPDPNGWHPDQKISLLEALYGYTAGSAYAGHFEHDLGQLSVGYFGDFIVLDQDPFALSPSEIVQLSPQSVAVGGEWVWRK